ncbi:long-chain fatty acid--CoA ligase [Mycobacterium szulgai]|uniref:Long-chain fatty acid--CoA ligase n=1 Tax=Mycobacterium szulgai TaxID=1787 RepID=A0A1X2ECS3_MYCSZ|nr:fatty acyl-AMP ligase [Mycobacterium szulgai]ORW98181.1 long-chain fatty acid--CoA ligase [Mycobacterium szulgai]
MSRFTDGIAKVAANSSSGLRFGAADQLRFASWGDIHQTASRVAARLAADGVTRGSKVSVLAVNAEDVAPVVQGIWMAGAAVTMLQQPTPNADLAEWHAGTMRALSLLDAHCVVVGQPFLALADTLRASGYRVIEIPETWPDVAAVDAAEVCTDEDDVALYQLTSGSTGDPKAVAITHRNLFADVEAMVAVVEIDPDVDITMSWLPLSHDMGLIVYLISPMWAGNSAVCIPPTEFVKSPLKWIQVLSEQRATVTAAPNFAYSIVSRRLNAVADGAYDLSALRLVVSGAEPIDPATMYEFSRQGARFGLRDSAVGAAYGLAEATVAVSFAPVHQPLAVETVCTAELENHGRAATACDCTAPKRDFVLLGAPMFGIEVRVADENGGTLPARHMGEIAIRGDAVSPHYLTVDGEVPAVDADGWLCTGDLGYLTDEGEIVVCGRRKNVIIVAGRNIFPSDIERLAASADGIRRGGVVAFGVTLPDRREEIRIVAETNEEYPSHVSHEIRRQITQRVRSATGLSPSVLLVGKGKVPKTPSGKIRHVAAKELFG